MNIFDLKFDECYFDDDDENHEKNNINKTTSYIN